MVHRSLRIYHAPGLCENFLGQPFCLFTPGFFNRHRASLIVDLFILTAPSPHLNKPLLEVCAKKASPFSVPFFSALPLCHPSPSLSFPSPSLISLIQVLIFCRFLRMHPGERACLYRRAKRHRTSPPHSAPFFLHAALLACVLLARCAHCSVFLSAPLHLFSRSHFISGGFERAAVITSGFFFVSSPKLLVVKATVYDDKGGQVVEGDDSGAEIFDAFHFQTHQKFDSTNKTPFASDPQSLPSGVFWTVAVFCLVIFAALLGCFCWVFSALARQQDEMLDAGGTSPPIKSKSLRLKKTHSTAHSYPHDSQSRRPSSMRLFRRQSIDPTFSASSRAVIFEYTQGIASNPGLGSSPSRRVSSSPFITNDTPLTRSHHNGHRPRRHSVVVFIDEERGLATTADSVPVLDITLRSFPLASRSPLSSADNEQASTFTEDFLPQRRSRRSLSTPGPLLIASSPNRLAPPSEDPEQGSPASTMHQVDLDAPSNSVPSTPSRLSSSRRSTNLTTDSTDSNASGSCRRYTISEEETSRHRTEIRLRSIEFL